MSFACTVRFFFSSRRRHTRFDCDWSSDVCSSDLRELVRHAQHAVGVRPQGASRAARLDPEGQRGRGPHGRSRCRAVRGPRSVRLRDDRGGAGQRNHLARVGGAGRARRLGGNDHGRHPARRVHRVPGRQHQGTGEEETVKVLKITPERCTGCLRCEIACSYMQVGAVQPAKSVIPVSPFEGHTSYAPYTCTQCAEGWCMTARSEEHTSELQSQSNLVCRLLLEKKKGSTSTRSR